MSEVKIHTSTPGTTAATENRVSLPKIVTSGLSGLAGGVAVASMILPAAGSLVIGSLIGAAITGWAEYKREKSIHITSNK